MKTVVAIGIFCISLLATVVGNEIESGNSKQNVNNQPTTSAPTTPSVTNIGVTTNNNTLQGDYKPMSEGMIKRSFFVALACIGIVILYFVIKYVCIKKKKKERRYGLLTSNDIEMNDVDSDEDDRTLFDASQAQRL